MRNSSPIEARRREREREGEVGSEGHKQTCSITAAGDRHRHHPQRAGKGKKRSLDPGYGRDPDDRVLRTYDTMMDSHDSMQHLFVIHLFVILQFSYLFIFIFPIVQR